MVTQSLVFLALNAFLWANHGDSIPSSYLLASCASWSVCLVAKERNKTKFDLDKTKRFKMLFALLTMSEVIFTILIPWLFILVDPYIGYLLAPHLFALQAQIALEGIFIQAKGHSMLVYAFTVVANLFRGLVLMTWITRTNDVVGLATSVKTLPRIAIFLWICSNLFIIFEWYPCIQRTKD